MKISEKDREFLIKNIDDAEEFIGRGDVGDLLALIQDAIIEEEIKHEEHEALSKKGAKLHEIYERIDKENHE